MSEFKITVRQADLKGLVSMTMAGGDGGIILLLDVKNIQEFALQRVIHNQLQGVANMIAAKILDNKGG